jgi:hypothetical protein
MSVVFLLRPRVDQNVMQVDDSADTVLNGPVLNTLTKDMRLHVNDIVDCCEADPISLRRIEIPVQRVRVQCIPSDSVVERTTFVRRP